MTEQNGQEPEVMKFGRFRLLQSNTGELWLYHTTGTCEDCQSCGCGEKQEPLPLPPIHQGPASAMAWLMKHRDSGIMAAVRRMIPQ